MKGRSRSILIYVMLYLQTNFILKGHITAVHIGKKPFKCDTWDVPFISRNSLIIHILSIHQMKRYKWTKCDACFTQEQG